MFNYNKKDTEFNKIGICWLMFNQDHKKFYDLVEKTYDDELYLMYDNRTYTIKLLDKLIANMKSDDVIKDDFVKFRNELVNTIDNMIYSKEIKEKYES